MSDLLSRLDYLDGLGTPDQRSEYRHWEDQTRELAWWLIYMPAAQVIKRRARRQYIRKCMARTAAWLIVSAAFIAVAWAFIVLSWAAIGG